MDKYSKYFHFPKGVLNQISECSPNGFVLFYIDNEGNPQTCAEFDTKMAELCLRTHAEKILKGINEAEESEIAENFYNDMHRDEGEEETGK